MTRSSTESNRTPANKLLTDYSQLVIDIDIFDFKLDLMFPRLS